VRSGDVPSTEEVGVPARWGACRRDAGGEPYGLLIGDYEIGISAEDIALLKMAAEVATAANAPLVAGAAPQLFSMDHFTELPRPRELIFDTVGHAAWRSFRETTVSR
jgi:type VI secretion system protein ImpC